MHWSNDFVGIEYKMGDFNCAHFVEMVMNMQFGKNLDLPKGGSNLFEQTRTINENRDKYLKKTDTITDGNLILMKGMKNLLHLGVGFKLNRVDYCLHCTSKGKFSRVDKVKNLETLGFKLVGFYEWLK